MDVEFERILSESFNNSSNNNIPISTSEANNVNDIFVGNEVKTECIICYEDNIPCIKCFQCTAVYCKLCLTKIASDSNKCICAIQIKSNYSILKKYNSTLSPVANAVLHTFTKDNTLNTTQNIDISNNNVKIISVNEDNNTESIELDKLLSGESKKVDIIYKNEDFNTMSIKQLKEIAKANNIKISGNKKDLINALSEIKHNVN